MKIDGRCHCGLISYEAQISPGDVSICHCTDCQTLTGTAFRTAVPAPAESFRLLSGQPSIYVKTAESGAQRAQAFCPVCGTPIYSAAAGEARTYMIRVGTVRQRAELIPRTQYWCRSALDWVMDLKSIKQIPRQQAL